MTGSPASLPDMVKALEQRILKEFAPAIRGRRADEFAGILPGSAEPPD
jgi:hypothetical protein